MDFENSRLAGLLVPVFALRHSEDLGIGDTRAVREAVDFCAENKFRVMQILPIHETIGDHSPYNPISSRALAPSFIELSPQSVPGLTPEMLEQSASPEWQEQLRKSPVVQHGSVHLLKLRILLEAGRAFLAFPPDQRLLEEFERFEQENLEWLPGYTLYRLLVQEYEGQTSWREWKPVHQSPASAEQWLREQPNRKELELQRRLLGFIQWVAARQWKEVREKAEAKGIFLMGEISFGIGKSSADTWARPDLFELEWNMGTRPISYFDTDKTSERWGQNWGLPPYRWEAHRAEDFAWLRARVQREARYFHVCRLDHLRGYFRAYMFPWEGGAVHASFAQLSEAEALQRTGGCSPKFVPGPDEDPFAVRLNDAQGREIIRVLREAAGPMRLVAEIMGEMPEYMARALEDLQMPNLTFPQLERGPDRSLKSKAEMRRLSLVTYANHDHAPLAAYYARLREESRREPEGTGATDLANLLAFADWRGPVPDDMNSELLAALQRALFETPCFLAVLLSSDLLGTRQRFNLPGSYGANTWCERLERPLAAYENDAVYGARIRRVEELIASTGRG